MSTIPTIPAPQLTPLPEMNPRIAGRPGEVVEQAGETTSNIGVYGVEVANQIRRTQNDGILLDAKNKITADMDAAHDKLATWTDYTNADQLKQTTADEMKAKYAELYQNKPALWRHIEPYIGAELNDYNRSVSDRSVTLTKNFNVAADIDAQLIAESDAANELTIEGKEKVWARKDAITDIMVANGTYTAQQGEINKKLLRTRTIDTEVARASNPTNSPEVMKQELEKLKTYAEKEYVDPEKLEQMQDHLTTSMDRAERRQNEVGVAKDADGFESSYRADPTLVDEYGHFDPAKAAEKAANDPDIKTGKVRTALIRQFDEQNVARKNADNDRDQKQMDDLQQRIGAAKNPLTSKEVEARMRLQPGQDGWISRRAGATTLRDIKADANAMLANAATRMAMEREARATSAEIKLDLLNTLPFLSDKSELTPYIAKGLRKDDLDTVWAMKNGEGVKDYRDAITMINASPNYPQTNEGNTEKANDLDALRKQVETQHLTGSQITKAASDILKPKVEAQTKSWIKERLDNLFTPGGYLNPSPGVANAPSAPTVSRGTPTTGTYNDFMASPDPKGLVQRGNLPIWNRPMVKNSDGTHSSEYSISIGTDKGEVLIPTVVDGKFLTPDGTKPPEGSTAEKKMFKAAEQHYKDTGENLGTFETAKDADAYANQLHNRGARTPVEGATKTNSAGYPVIFKGGKWQLAPSAPK